MPLPASASAHSIFFTILKYAYRYQASSIVREEQRTRFVREMVEKLKLEIEDEHDFISSVLGEISFVKSEMVDLAHYYSQNCSEEMFKEIYAGYEERMRRANLLDFDDMLVMCHELFTKRPDILAAWQKKFRYILVDEFQDINKVQYEIVRMLAKPEDNLFIVGDDDQSVYRFRGSKPEIMLGFPKDYPEAKTVLLGVNYRSTIEIVETASRLIRHNQKRYDKKLEAARGHGRPVITCVSADAQAETLRIVDEIKGYVQAGYKLEGIPIHIRNTNRPKDKGTLIVESTCRKPRYVITGIAGKRGFCSVTVEKAMMNAEVGFCRKVLSVFEKYGVSIEHMPSGIDTMTIFVHQSEFEEFEQSVIAGIHRAVEPDLVEMESDLALIAVVGRGMKAARGTAGRIFSALAHARINVKMIDQGSSERNIIIGVKDADFEAAIKAIYDIFVTMEL